MLLRFPKPKAEWPSDRWLAAIQEDGRAIGVMCPSGFAVVVKDPKPDGNLLAQAADALNEAQCVWLDISDVRRTRGSWRIQIHPEGGVSFVLEPPIPGLEPAIIRARMSKDAPTGWARRLRKARVLHVPQLALLRGAALAWVDENALVADFSGPPGRLVLPLEGGPFEGTSKIPARFPFDNLSPEIAVVLPPEDLRDSPALMLLAKRALEGREMIHAAGVISAREIIGADYETEEEE